MTTELKRRDLSGIYIFDTLPGDTRRKPTCVEDCTPEKRREWCLTKSQDYLRDVINKECDTFNELCDYLVTEKCVTEEQRTELRKMIDGIRDRARWNWAEHELADQVDTICEKVRLLADMCGVTKHRDDDDDDHPSDQPDGLLATPLTSCDLSVRTLNICKANGIETLGDLTKLHRTDWLKFRNTGKQSLAEIDDLLTANGLTWAEY